MKNKIKTIIYKVHRWVLNNQPEDLLKVFRTAQSNYFADKELINEKDFYINYAKRY